MVIAKENRLALRFAVLAAALVASLALALFKANGQDAKAWSKMKADVNLFVANDLGRNGYYQQRPIAELMGNMAEEIGPECAATTNIAATRRLCSTMHNAAAAG